MSFLSRSLNDAAGPGNPPIFLRFRSSKWFITITVALAVFTDIFLYGVIVPVVPFALNSRAGVPENETQTWVSILLAVYGAALLIAAPMWGFLSDLTTSRRWPFLAGLILLIGSTVMLCVSNSIALFIIGRIFQGVSSAVVWVTGLVIVVDTVGQKDVGQFMGYLGLAMSLGVLLAPLLGGIVYAQAGYYSVFAMCFGILVCDVLLRIVMIERSVAAKWIDFDGATEKETELQVKQVPSEVGLQSDQDERGDFQDLKQSQPAPPTKLTPIRSELRPAKTTIQPNASWRIRLPPIITLLASRRLLASLWGSFIQAALLTSFDSTLPLRVSALFGWDSLGAGLVFIPLIIPTFTGPLVGFFSDKYGPKWPCTIGFLTALPVLVCLRFITHDGLSQKVLLCALLALLGVSLTLVLTPVMAEIAYVVEEKEKKRPGVYGAKGAYAQAYALFNMAFAAGCLVGPIWGGLIKDRAGWGTMCWTLGLLSAFTSVVSLGWVGGWIGSVGMKGGGGHGGDHGLDSGEKSKRKDGTEAYSEGA